MSLTKELFSKCGIKKESITPHKIAIAILIRQFCLFKECGKQVSNKYPTVKQTTLPAHRRDFNIMILSLIQGPDLNLTELRTILHSGPYVIDQKFYKDFDVTLKNLHNVGVGYLLDLLEYISRLTMDIQLNGVWCQINKSSVLGCYLRRLYMNFEKLNFAQVIDLYDAFKMYYSCAEKENKQRNFIQSSSIFNETPNEMNVTQPQSCYVDENHWSKKQAELFIATQSALLQMDDKSAHTPIELDNKIRELLRCNPDMAEAHFLSYLNYLRVREYCYAIDSLYHSFDRSAPISNDNKNYSTDEKIKGFRYAALNLAVLHVQFGHKEEAIAALKESIMAAQAANDNVCLQHALTWMYKLANQQDKKLLMEHSVTKSMELNLTYISSLGIEAYTQHAGLSGGNPKQIFENLIKSDVLNCQLSYRDLMSNSYGQKAALWFTYGKMEMSILWSQMLLNLNTENLSLGIFYNGEALCQSMCNIANNFLFQGEYQLSMAMLKLARRTFPNQPLCNDWILCEFLHYFTRNLYNGNWLAAEQAATQIAAYDKWESVICMGQLFMTKGDYESALECVDQIIDENSEKEPDTKTVVSIKIRAMILLAEIHCASVTSTYVPTSVIPILNSALSLAQLYHQDLYTPIIHLLIANVQLLMGMPAQALKICDKVLVDLLAHGSIYDRARGMLLFVKCLIAHANCNPAVDKYSVVLECTELLKGVKDDFMKCEAYLRVRDVIFLMTKLYNEIQHFEDRNNCAFEYKQFLDEYPTKNSRTLVTSL